MRTLKANKKRVAVLISGRGSNMMSLATAAQAPDYPAKIMLVIANKPDAGGLSWARAQGITSLAINEKDFSTRELHEAAIHLQLLEHNIELVCLAGYMRILTPEFVEKWPGKMLNIHPSLLPAFPGLDTHQRALDAGAKEHGCTVHFVTGELDGGPKISQAIMPVLANDDAESLAARVLKKEHILYPQALAMVAENSNAP